MGKSTILVTLSQIKETKVFKGLSGVTQKVISQQGNVKQIEHGLRVSINIGFENWKKQSATSKNNENIINELLLENENINTRH